MEEFTNRTVGQFPVCRVHLLVADTVVEYVVACCFQCVVVGGCARPAANLGARPSQPGASGPHGRPRSGQSDAVHGPRQRMPFVHLSNVRTLRQLSCQLAEIGSLFGGPVTGIVARTARLVRTEWACRRIAILLARRIHVGRVVQLVAGQNVRLSSVGQLAGGTHLFGQLR